MTEPTVKACPVCGCKALVSCYHDGMDVSTVVMPISKAIQLAKMEARSAKAYLEVAEDHLAELRDIERESLPQQE